MQQSDASVYPTPGAPRWREGMLWLLALAAVRIGVMLAIGWVTGGRHFTDDWRFLMGFIEDPFQILLARGGEGVPYRPPLEPIVDFLFGYPFARFLPSFYSVRCASILQELVAWPIIWRLLTTGVSTLENQRLLALTYVLMPVGWATTSLFAEEEPLSLMLLAAIMLLVLKNRYRSAILVAGIGVVTAKVYFLIPLLALIAGPRTASLKELGRRLVLGATPIMLVYGIVQFALFRQNKPAPLLEFTPHGVHSTSIWVLIRAWLDLSLVGTKYISMVTGLCAGLIPLVVARIRRVRCEGMTLVRIMVAMQLFVYMWFYHCDPEYYLIIVPGLLISYPPVAAAATALVGLAIPYAINLFYGVARAGDAGSEAGKMVIARLYQRFIPLDPDVMHTVSLLALCGLSLVLTIWLTARIARSPRLDGA